MHTRPYLAASALLLAALGCRDDAGAPTEPAPTAPEPNVAGTTVLEFRQVSAGKTHTCAVTTEDQAYCWGTNGDGQLGVGTEMDFASEPNLVAGGLRFRQVSAGWVHSCGVTAAHRAYCWGSNAEGQLGDGTRTERLSPVAVLGGRQFLQIDAGDFFTCGVTYPEGQAYCWGVNREGQLGDGTRTGRLLPAAVLGERRFRQLSAGYQHTCGVTRSDLAFCWGWNEYGQVGDSSELTRRLKPKRVAGAHQFSEIDAGSYHSCALTTANRAFCWGRGGEGQVGNGKTYLSFFPRAVSGGLYFKLISAGLFHTCGVTTTNRAYCWGSNTFGQLGDDTGLGRLRPVAVTGGLNFSQVSAGGWHTCGKTSTNEGYCWGDGLYGQLGDGWGEYGHIRLAPFPVLGPS